MKSVSLQFPSCLPNPHLFRELTGFYLQIGRAEKLSIRRHFSNGPFRESNVAEKKSKLWVTRVVKGSASATTATSGPGFGSRLCLSSDWGAGIGPAVRARRTVSGEWRAIPRGSAPRGCG